MLLGRRGASRVSLLSISYFVQSTMFTTTLTCAEVQTIAERADQAGLIGLLMASRGECFKGVMVY